jgi:hypothetical protein
MTLRIECRCAEYRYAECRYVECVMLSVVAPGKAFTTNIRLSLKYELSKIKNNKKWRLSRHENLSNYCNGIGLIW